MSENLTLPRHLYVHVPLCRSRCAYCGFYSAATCSSPIPEQDVALGLIRQAEAWLRRDLPAAALDTLYIGGGTPTVLGGGLPLLVASVARSFGLAEDAEVTVEANPDSLDARLVRMLPPAGVTRVSLGVQSFDDEELRALKRPHDAGQAKCCAGEVLSAGLELSVDLMCGIPGQTQESWERSLGCAIGLGCGHVSVYPLSLEEGTQLADQVEAGHVVLPTDEEVASMLEYAAVALASAGLARYEVASFAHSGRESRHNTAYWTGAEYLGVGPSAHGMLSIRTAEALGVAKATNRTARVRYSVPADVCEGLESDPPLELEHLRADEVLREDAMLGMRMAVGITDELAAMAGATDALSGLEGDELVVHAEGRWTMSPSGWLLGNEVFGRIWLRDQDTSV
ncbi:MAG: radical SAM family heme chaperone HemW [Coriobacteriia bacterium]